MWQSARIVLRVGRNLGEADVARFSDEAAELGIRHRRVVHPEPIDLNAVSGLLLCIMMIRAHGELATRDVDHLGSWPHFETARPSHLPRDAHFPATLR